MFIQTVVVCVVALLASTFIVATTLNSDFTIHQEGRQHECTNSLCSKGAFDKAKEHSLTKDNSKEKQKCIFCSQCTTFGYSICAQPLSKSLRFKEAIDEDDYCTCSNIVPESCKPVSSKAKEDDNNRIFKLCYLSSLRIPPMFVSLDKEKDLNVIFKPFWLEPYWNDFELSNLTLFYRFEVKYPALCDEVGNITSIINDSKSIPLHLCTSSLHMTMHGKNIVDDESNKDYIDPTFYNLTNIDDYDTVYPPEVEFSKDTFVGAQYVDLLYTVNVRRPRQLNFGENLTHDVTTIITSETLKHILKPENDSIIGEQHSAPWHWMGGMVFVLGLIVIVILIFAAVCFYRYRGCECCYSNKQNVGSKNSNGNGYHHVTVSSIPANAGQEKIMHSPETQKLIQ